MDANDERRLALAAKVWRDAKTSDAEVERHVVRVARRLRTARRHHPLRRFLAFLIAVLSFGGALAFAASGSGVLPWFEQVAKPAKTAAGGAVAALPPPEAVQPSAARGAAPVAQRTDDADDGERTATSPAPPAEDVTEPPASDGSPAPRLAASSPRAAAAGAAPSHGSTRTSNAGSAPAAPAERTSAGSAETRLWHTVSSALAEDDLSTATTALQRLATRGTPETRVKARLGLVQLAVSRGDCSQAERLAKGLAADLDSNDRVVKRALHAARTCFGR